MALASLFNVPDDPESLSAFSFANNDEHVKIAARIQQIYGIRLTQFIIDPIPMFDPLAWATAHQQMHNQQNEVLGIAGNDLSGIEFNDKEELNSWIRLHAAEHVQAAQILQLN